MTADRARVGRAIAAEVTAELAGRTRHDDEFEHRDCVEGECSQAPRKTNATTSKGDQVSGSNAELITEARALSPAHLLAAIRLIPLGEIVQGCVRSDGQQTRDAIKAAFLLKRKLADALEASEARAARAQEMLRAHIERSNALAADLALARSDTHRASRVRLPMGASPVNSDKTHHFCNTVYMSATNAPHGGTGRGGVRDEKEQDGATGEMAELTAAREAIETIRRWNEWARWATLDEFLATLPGPEHYLPLGGEGPNNE